MSARAAVLVASSAFRRTVLGAILLAAVVVGLETDPQLMARHGQLIILADWLAIGLFALEAALKMLQHGSRWYRYFGDPWNVFDFTILAVCLLPVGGHFAAVLRLVRVLRALRLVSALPRLQLLVSALLKSVPSMGYVGLLLLLLFYIYGVLGVALFRGNDPVHFGSLQLALLTLFRVVTLEDWTDVMYIQMFGSDVFAIDNPMAAATAPHAQPLLGAAYFVSFVLLGTMIMLNLFIGVIVGSMQEAQADAERRARRRHDADLSAELDDLAERLDHIRRRAHAIPPPPRTDAPAPSP
ncbi:MAG: ion transporter [Candidatus Krumholzibacteriia bacterium]